MSIINQMLKDIEKRRNGSNNGGDNNPLSTPEMPHADQHGRLKKLLLILLAVIIICSMAFFWHKAKTSASSTVKVGKKENFSITKILNRETALPSLHSIETSFEGSGTENIETMTFEFDALPKYHMSKQLNNHEITLTFEGINNNDDIQLDSLELVDTYSTNFEEDTLTIHLFINRELNGISIKPENDNLVLTMKANIANEEKKPESENIVTITPKQQRQLIFEEALAILQSGNQAKALTEMTKILEEDQEYHDVRESIALIYLQENKNDEAIELLNIGIQLNRGYEPFIRLKARALLAKDQAQEAADLLHTISPELKSAPKFYALNAAIQQRLGNYIYSAQLYRQLLTTFPNNGVWWVGLGISLQSADQNNAALEAYQRAIATKTLKPNLIAFAHTQIAQLGG